MMGPAATRPSPLDVCQRGLLDSDFTRAMAAVEELLVAENRVALLEQIQQALPSVPPNVLTYKFVPKLAAAAETGEGMDRFDRWLDGWIDCFFLRLVLTLLRDVTDVGVWTVQDRSVSPRSV